MVLPSPAKILIGLSLDPDDSKELLSWAIRVVAHPNDTIVALHVLAAEGKKKRVSVKSRQSQLRHAKAYVISVLGEFAKTCWSKQINLEAKVALTSKVGRGLVEEAKSSSADFLLLHGSKNQSNKIRTSTGITKYCFEHAHEGCTVVSVGKFAKTQQFSIPNSAHSQDNCQLSSRWLKKDNHRERATSPVLKDFISETKAQNRSPRTVLDGLDEQSTSTEDDTSSTRASSITDNPSQDHKVKSQSKLRKPQSPFRLIASFLGSPLRRRNRIKFKKENRQPLLKCFSYEEISNATNDFHQDNLAGKGGYSEVYKGDLSDGQTIAVKRLTKGNQDPNKEKEFLMELGVIGHVCHPNTATLVGCCIENGLYLIFNYSQNGNLATALHGKAGKSLDWKARYKIAVGVAKGLHYLHKCCKHRIIHRDIKASNVLLGPDYDPQITDFGLAKWLPNKWSHHAIIPVEGTFGYLAPEYFMHGMVDEKTDVFAFGVLLLEIVTGRRPVDSSKQNLLLWVTVSSINLIKETDKLDAKNVMRRCSSKEKSEPLAKVIITVPIKQAKPLMEAGSIAELADPNLGGNYDEEQLYRVALTASYCVRQTATWRPPISEVLELLTTGQDPVAGKSWRIPKFTSDELDDYSLVFGYEVPSDISLEDFL